MDERAVDSRTIAGCVMAVAAVHLMDTSEDGAERFVGRCPLPIGIVDVRDRKIVSMSHAMEDVLAAGGDRVGTAPRPPLAGFADADSLFDLLAAGAIDACMAHLTPVGRNDEALRADSWLLMIDRTARRRALWLLVPPDQGVATAGWAPTEIALPAMESGLVVGSFDISWRILRINEDVEQSLGYSVDELYRMPITALVLAEDLPMLFQAVADCSASRSAVGLRLRFCHRDGGWTALSGVLTMMASDVMRFGFAFAPRSDEGEEAYRATRLEGHLRRIAAEVALSGVDPVFKQALDPAAAPLLRELSSRQWEILQRLLEGQRVPAIARQLYVSQSTVRNHLTSMFRRLGVRSQQELLDLVQTRHTQAPSTGSPSYPSNREGPSTSP